MKARCPHRGCDQLVGISPTGQRIAEDGSAKWWKIDVHAAPADGPYRGTICEGSGKLV